jgi:type II secretory pathway component PulJ
MRLREIIDNDSGFTLVEILIVSQLMLVVMGAAWLAFNTVNGNINTVSGQTTLSNDTDAVMNTWGREIRQAQEISAGSGVFRSAGPNDISFYSNVSGGADMPNIVHYYRDGNILYRSVSKTATDTFSYDGAEAPALMAASGLEGEEPIFRFYDNSSPTQEIVAPTASDYNRISMVSMRFTSTLPVNGQLLEHSTDTTVKIRCMFDSLN